MRTFITINGTRMGWIYWTGTRAKAHSYICKTRQTRFFPGLQEAGKWVKQGGSEVDQTDAEGGL